MWAVAIPSLGLRPKTPACILTAGDSGIVHYRLEFVDETANTVTEVAQLFRRGLDGQLTSTELTAKLKEVAPQGTTEGSLFVPNGFMELPVL